MAKLRVRLYGINPITQGLRRHRRHENFLCRRVAKRRQNVPIYSEGRYCRRIRPATRSGSFAITRLSSLSFLRLSFDIYQKYFGAYLISKVIHIYIYLFIYHSNTLYLKVVIQIDEIIVIQQLQNLYCFDMTRYRYMTSDGQYHSVKIPFDETELFEHLDGKKTLCVYARQRNTIFQCFDVDESNPEHIHVLVRKLVESGIPEEYIYISISGNKGYHVEIFFDGPVWKSDVENFYNCLRRDPEIAKIKMECKPGRNGAIKLPLGINFRTGRRCWYVDRDTLEPIESMDYVFSIQKMSAAEFCKVVHECNKQRKVADIMLAKKNAGKQKNKQKKYSVRNEPVITAPGQRHDKMLQRAVWLRTMGGEADDIYEELMNWIERQDPSLITSSWKEIEDDAERIAHDVVCKYEVKAVQRRKFSCGQQKLDKRDIEIILNEPTKTARKAAFLVCASCKVYGSCGLGYEKISQILGVTYQTAFNAIKALIKNGIIEKKKVGGIVYTDGEPRLLANEYVLCDNIPIYDPIEITSDFQVSLREMCTSFNEYYYKTLAKMCHEKDLAKYLTRSELEECRKVSAA